ncbi:hypothetical protein BH23CHL5_BH23CHL5_28060 [soil metagenome]
MGDGGWELVDPDSESLALCGFTPMPKPLTPLRRGKGLFVVCALVCGGIDRVVE